MSTFLRIFAIITLITSTTRIAIAQTTIDTGSLAGIGIIVAFDDKTIDALYEAHRSADSGSAMRKRAKAFALKIALEYQTCQRRAIIANFQMPTNPLAAPQKMELSKYLSGSMTSNERASYEEKVKLGLNQINTDLAAAENIIEAQKEQDNQAWIPRRRPQPNGKPEKIVIHEDRDLGLGSLNREQARINQQWEADQTSQRRIQAAAGRLYDAENNLRNAETDLENSRLGMNRRPIWEVEQRRNSSENDRNSAETELARARNEARRAQETR